MLEIVSPTSIVRRYKKKKIQARVSYRNQAPGLRFKFIKRTINFSSLEIFSSLTKKANNRDKTACGAYRLWCVHFLYSKCLLVQSSHEKRIKWRLSDLSLALGTGSSSLGNQLSFGVECLILNPHEKKSRRENRDVTLGPLKRALNLRFCSVWP